MQRTPVPLPAQRCNHFEAHPAERNRAEDAGQLAACRIVLDDELGPGAPACIETLVV